MIRGVWDELEIHKDIENPCWIKIFIVYVIFERSPDLRVYFL